MAKKLISIVTPVFNESANIDYYFEKMNPVLETLASKYNFEFIFTDNRSTDNTYSKLKKLAVDDKRIRVFRFSRNFGYQKSIFTGYSLAKGDATIEFDCDLQDPVSMIPEFLQLWEEGNEIVFGIRTHRPEGFIITSLRKIFYRMLAMISEDEIPVDAGDFMLLDRKVITQLTKVKDYHIYIRGLVFGFGFKQIGISYARDARVHGDSKFPIKKMFLLALDGVVSQSIVPLRIASFVGLLISIGTFFLILIYGYLKITKGIELAGFTTLVILILLSIGLNSIFLGVIGEYLARIYLQTKSKPITIIDEFVENVDN
jgi:dolichol-phosphate mannosyltransferase